MDFKKTNAKKNSSKVISWMKQNGHSIRSLSKAYGVKADFTKKYFKGQIRNLHFKDFLISMGCPADVFYREWMNIEVSK